MNIFILKAAGISLLTLLLMYLVPTHFEVRFTAAVSGEKASVQTAPRQLEQWWMKEHKAPILCAADKTSQARVTCTMEVERLSLARRAKKAAERLKKSFGWTSPADLKKRLEKHNTEMDALTQSLSQTEQYLATLAPTEAKRKSLYDSMNARLKTLKTDLDNKQRQLAIVESSIPEQKEEDQAQFISKRDELRGEISSLEEALLLAEKDMEDAGFDYATQKKLELEKTSLQNSMDHLMTKIVRISSLLDNAAPDAKIPDPEAFQVQDIPSFETVGFHSWQSLSWSILLGLFIFGLFMKPLTWVNPFNKRLPDAPILDTREIETYLNAPYLGTWPLRHPHDNVSNLPKIPLQNNT